jgi:glutamate racemase
VRELVTTFTSPLKAAGVDTVVLGCTHYPFVAPLIVAEMGEGVQLVDTAEAVARHTTRLVQRVIKADDADDTLVASTGSEADVSLWTSASPAALGDIVHRWLGIGARAAALPA